MRQLAASLRSLWREFRLERERFALLHAPDWLENGWSECEQAKRAAYEAASFKRDCTAI